MDKGDHDPSVWELLTARATVRRATRVGLIVGTVLVTINQWEAVSGDAPFDVLKVILTYMVPYCVSSYSAVMAYLEFNKPNTD
ncbi:nitrate/nitrite transporter NrtS [Kordiimonas aquimaris]|uniref:nitrate/nitrite transporter NrtS n=1 Tax=Kordiimonas aquimaris TaxID=707591 RepID=UPI0021D352DD|nr:nitrate/nitrite transporter NrtS [Kordiimonas aquimaris]